MQFSFTDANVAAVGCDPADPAGGFCLASSGTPTLPLDAAPWTFTAPASGAVLVVTDAFTSGDQFEVFDFGASLGLTSATLGTSDCGDDPVPCLADPDISKRSFHLSEGDHFLAIIPVLVTGAGSGYLRVTAVPEPSSLILLVAGLGIVCSLVWRRRSAASASIWGAACTMIFLLPSGESGAVDLVTRFTGPTSSQPLALTADDAFLVVANPDNNSVTFFDLRGDRNRRLATVPVQSEPSGVAFLPDGSKVYVANTVSGTVTVIKTNIRNGVISRPVTHIKVGTEPYGLALTPNGRKLYVSNARSNSLSVIDTQTDLVIKTISGVGVEPRGLAITNDGDDDDNDETVFVTQFLALPQAGKVDGADDAKIGLVTRVSTLTDAVIGQVGIDPLADTGFKALGDALARIPPGDASVPENFKFTTGAYPNQLNNVAVHGNFVYVPSTGASPNGPIRFDVNTHSLLSVIDRTFAVDTHQTINMHVAVKNQINPLKLFITQPWAIGFKHQKDEGYVISAASNIAVKIAVGAGDGAASVQTDPSDTLRVLEIPVGKNPRGIVVNAADTRAYVMNYISRDVSVIDLTTSPERVAVTMPSAALPIPGSTDEMVHIGKELYNTSVGVFDPPAAGGSAIVGRMSKNGWGSCAACHTPFGLSDNVVWIFPSGPRRTIPQHTDFDRTSGSLRALNWSAERDEEEDFELNIRGVSGGAGLIVLTDGVTQDPNVSNFTPPSGGRNQLKVRGVGAWDAIKAFVQVGPRAPISPVAKTSPDVIAGGALFRAANCQQCHGGGQWTSSLVRFTPPPAAGVVVAGELISELRKVGTFDSAAFNEVRANGSPSLGADGFAPASLLSLFAFPQTFLHNGAVRSLDEVLNNVTHRSAGTSGVDILTNAADRAKIVEFLLSIDASTLPIPIP